VSPHRLREPVNIWLSVSCIEEGTLAEIDEMIEHLNRKDKEMSGWVIRVVCWALLS
jgi:hypothetical protein